MSSLAHRPPPMSPEVAAARFLSLPTPRLLALDVDGTLAPIAARPEQARVPSSVLDTLGRLLDRPELHLALLTGRDPAALAKLVPLEGCWRAVEHGRRLAPPGSPMPEAPLTGAERAALDRFATWAEESGATVERKPNAVGLHVRPMAAQDPGRAEALLREGEARARAIGLRVRHGRAMVEAEAGEPSDKGRALRTIVERTGTRGVLFAGDDLTDRPALATARRLGGLALFVGSEERKAPPEAHGVLGGPDAVAVLLATIAHEVGLGG